MWKSIIIFFDDIIMFSKSVNEHAEHLRIALDLMRRNNLIANLEMFFFERWSLPFLGHIIAGDEIRHD